MKKALKRIVPVILSIAFVLSSAACGGNSPEEQAPDEEVLYSAKSMKMLAGGFTDIVISDEESAIEAATIGAKDLGYKNALNLLQCFGKTSIGGETYYRLRPAYQGISVYGRYVIVAADESGQAVSLNTNVRDLPDSINTQVTASDAQIVENVKQFAAFHCKALYDDIKITPVSEAEKVIYDLDDKVEARVCLKLNVTNGGAEYEVIADGETGVIRSAVATDKSVAGAGTDGTDTSGGDPVYTLGDGERNIHLFYLNGGSSDNIKEYFEEYPPNLNTGDTVFEKDQEEPAVYAAVLKTVDYYQDTFGQGIPYGGLLCCYDDTRGGGRDVTATKITFRGSDSAPSATYSLLSIGTSIPADSYELLGREYAHCIQSEMDAAVGESDPGISEGIADIFGYFFEAYCTGSTDWDMDLTAAGLDGHRNASSPESYHYPRTVAEENTSGEDDAHGYATAISRIAYLMSESGEFSFDELQMLWYKTLCRLPHSPSYDDLGDCLKLAVESKYGKESAQFTTIQDILSQVGIVSGSYIECGKNIKLTVYDKNGEPYDDYRLEIDGEAVTGFLTRKKEHFHQEYTVSSPDPYELKLNNGTYICSITDNADNPDVGGSRSQDFEIFVSAQNTQGDIECTTGFGADLIAAPGAQLTVLDINGDNFEDYEATAITNGQNIVINNGVLDLEEHNNYLVLLKNTKGSVSHYDSFVLRVKEGGDTAITKKTDFIGSSIITGKVIDSETNAPLGGVQIEYTDPNNPDNAGNTTTAADGSFMIDGLNEGTIRISLSCDGFSELAMEQEIGPNPAKYDLNTIKMRKMDLETQLKIIADNYVQWDRINTGSAPRSGFAITDINNNGRLEVIVTATMGTGIYSETHIFEVNEDLSGLIECSFESDYSPDLILDDSADVFLVNEDYKIMCVDGGQHGIFEYYSTLLSLSLVNTDIVIEKLGDWHLYNSMDGTSTEEYHDRNDNAISEQEYNSLADSTFSGCPKGEITFKWIYFYETKPGDVDQLKESWDGFSCSLFH